MTATSQTVIKARKEAIFAIIEKLSGAQLKAEQISDLLVGKPSITLINKAIRELVDEGRVEREGSGRHFGYVLRVKTSPGAKS
jgi:hypothetical protein